MLFFQVLKSTLKSLVTINYHKTKKLKTTISIYFLSWFLCVRRSEVARVGGSLPGLSGDAFRHRPGMPSSEGSSGLEERLLSGSLI